MRIATRLAGIDLEDPDGARQRLGDLWRQKPAVLVFIRHFG